VLSLPRQGRQHPIIPIAIGRAVFGVVTVIAKLTLLGDESRTGNGELSPTNTPFSVTVTAMPTTTGIQADVPLSDPNRTPARTPTQIPEKWRFQKLLPIRSVSKIGNVLKPVVSKGMEIHCLVLS
jgi:hypothetical protein